MCLCGWYVSKSTPYATYLQRDIFDLTWVPDASSPTGYTARNPCGDTVLHNNTSSSDAAPFVNVVDPVHGAVCSDSSLTTYFAGLGNNESILLNLEPGLFATSVNRPAWVEIHAQIFAYMSVGAQGARPMMDTVLQNAYKAAFPIPQRYFGCVESWAASELAGTAPSVPTTPSGSCSVAPPTL